MTATRVPRPALDRLRALAAAPPEPKGPARPVALLALACVALAALSLLGPSTPTYDPWAWIIWGREVMHLDLVTTDGPSWKPLPILFTGAVLAGRRRAGARAVDPRRARRRAAGDRDGVPARRAAGRPRGRRDRRRWRSTLADEFVRNFARGNSEGLLVAFCLLALERHLDGRRRDAFLLGFLAGLLRPEVWPLWALYGLWYVAVEWRGRPPWRTIALVGGSGLFTLVVWFVPEYLGSGSLLRAAERALQPNPDSAAFAASPFLEVFRRSASVLSVPVYAARLVGVALARAAPARALRGGGGDARGALDGADDRRRADDRGRLRRQPALRRAARRDGLHPRRRRLGRALPAGAAPRLRRRGRRRWPRSRSPPRRRSSSSTAAQFGKAMDRLAWEADLYGANLKAMIAKAGGEERAEGLRAGLHRRVPDPGRGVVPAPARDRRLDLPDPAGDDDRPALHRQRPRSALPDGHEDVALDGRKFLQQPVNMPLTS